VAARPTCLEALDAFAAKDFESWHGLPSACTVAEALRVFAAQDDWIGEAKLGLEAVSRSYRFCGAARYESPLRVWFQGSEILMVEAEAPLDDLPLQTLTAQLGAPTAKLDTYFGVVKVKQGEWVYAERGIALSIDSSGASLSRICVFAPTTLEQYRRSLRLDVRQRPLPRASGR
jgi:hypothetical protein